MHINGVLLWKLTYSKFSYNRSFWFLSDETFYIYSSISYTGSLTAVDRIC
jgi:hypothetical protein